MLYAPAAHTHTSISSNHFTCFAHTVYESPPVIWANALWDHFSVLHFVVVALSLTLWYMCAVCTVYGNFQRKFSTTSDICSQHFSVSTHFFHYFILIHSCCCCWYFHIFRSCTFAGSWLSYFLSHRTNYMVVSLNISL